MDPAALRTALGEQVANEKFHAFGVARVKPLLRDQAAFDEWLQNGYQASMSYMEKYRAARKDPEVLLPGCRSVIMVAMNYGPGLRRSAARSYGASGSDGIVARYARGRDYHKVMGNALKRIVVWLEEQSGRAAWSFVDTGPVLERAWAEQSGLGWIGKNANLIRRDIGSWLLLGEILSAAEIEPDPVPHRSFCGTCSACIEDCPTGAIVAPGRVDSSLCISYWTIEHRGSVPLPMREKIGNHIFGCDDCQTVCPWTSKFGTAPAESPLAPRGDLQALDPLEILGMDREQFLARFAGTPVMRARLDGMRRNACIVLGNQGDPKAEPALEKATNDPDAMIREHAAWALERLRR